MILVFLLLTLSGGHIAVAAQPVIAITDEYLKARDPFKAPRLQAMMADTRGELELHPVDALRMIGVLTGPDHLRAMILTPDGRTHLVSERMKIGTKGGYIKMITTDAVIVREKMINVLGEEEGLESEIRLMAESKQQQAQAGVPVPEPGTSQ